MDLKTLKTRIQSLVDDQSASYADDSFLLPLINQKYEETANRMLATGYEFDVVPVVLSNIQPLTTDLSNYQQTGQPLEFLFQPTNFEWKLAGTPDENYLPARFVDLLPDRQPTNIIECFAWISGVLKFNACTTPVDLRITGKFLLSPLSTDTDQIQAMRNLGTALAYGVASLIGMVRGNPQWEKSYGDRYDDSLDDVMQAMTRADIAKIRRIGRMSRYRRGTPFALPTSSTGVNTTVQPTQQVNTYNADATLPSVFQNLLAEATVAGITLALPSNPLYTGATITIVNLSSGTVYVSIPGGSTYNLVNNGQLVAYTWDGANWILTAQN